MDNTVFDILVYVFDRYMLEELPAETERETIERDLARVGFGEAKVTRALDWLADLADSRSAAAGPSTGSWRVYSSAELRRLDLECRSLLASLEQGGLLTSAQREIVIDRLMALDTDELSPEQVKWVVMMVLSSQPAAADATPFPTGLLPVAMLSVPH
jgi:Smg protein